MQASLERAKMAQAAGALAIGTDFAAELKPSNTLFARAGRYDAGPDVQIDPNPVHLVELAQNWVRGTGRQARSEKR